jgi:hypothetical protein
MHVETEVLHPGDDQVAPGTVLIGERKAGTTSPFRRTLFSEGLEPCV